MCSTFRTEQSELEDQLRLVDKQISEHQDHKSLLGNLKRERGRIRSRLRYLRSEEQT